MIAGVAILAVLVWRVGTAPVLDGIRSVNALSLVLAVGIAVPTTVASAWRWRLVARGLGAEISLGPAVARYYRSQFLNTVLPGGVLGDVHRGLQHGRDRGDAARGLRAVFWERASGQAVQLVVALGVLAAVPSPVRSLVPLLALAVVALGVTVVLLDRWAPPLRSDLREGVLARAVWPGVVLASVTAVAGHVAMFVLAARTAGVDASAGELLPLALLVLLAMGIPANVAGWGPREGVAVWAFAAVGLGASAGLSTAVVYGVLTFVSVLPGAVVLLAPLALARQVRTAEPPVVGTPVPAGVAHRD